MKKMTNRERISGYVYDHNLAIKVTGPNSKKPGTSYINGTLDIATDDACLNIVTVNFTYVTETTNAGSKNATYGALASIINSENKTVLSGGRDEAIMVTIDTALGLNDFYTNRNGEETLVSAKRNDGGFVRIVNKLDAEEKRNSFEFDILINGTKRIEADPEKHIDNDYLVVKGAVFNFRNAFLPVELIVKNSGGINYFENLDVSPSNLVFTKVWGKIESQTIVTKSEQEAAFGEAAVREYSRTVREWVITGAAKEPYDMDDEQNGITKDEVKKAIADREIYLADIKKRNDEYLASKATTEAASAGVSAAAGGFNF